MFLLAGLVFVVDLLPSIEAPPLLQYLVFGVLFGGTAGKTVVVRRERRSGELPPDQVRHMEHVGIAAGVALMALAVVVQVVLALL
jgi:lipid-binding SYLF domain-containing protein